MDELWERFLKSGAIKDYIRYKQSGEKNADDPKRSRPAGEKSR